MRRCLRDPTFSRFDIISECDRHTDTRRRHIPRLARRRAVKTGLICELFVRHGKKLAYLVEYLRIYWTNFDNLFAI